MSKGKIIRRIIIFITVCTVLYLAIYPCYIRWITGNYAKRFSVVIKDFSDYSDYILVREVHYTGTGWSMIDDKGGYFPSEVDVILEGEELPEAHTPTERYNTFLCIVEYKGKKEHVAFEEKLDCYVIKDWYPVYPVVRNRLLPQFFYPRRYMTEKDLKGY